MEAGEIIAYNLKRLRNEKNLTLGQLANMAGVSKVVLSQIEKGEANPTINTIWKITGALQLPYSALLEMPEKAAVQIRKKEISALSEDKYHIFNYYAKTADRNFELYQIEVEPGCEHASIGHSTNSFEYLMMLKGELILETGGEAYALKKDDAICFDASGAHSYKNVGKKDAKAVLLIHYR
mgnify:FL=1|jgi:putative transcriptional regulator